MKDTNGHSRQKGPGGPEDSPEPPTVVYTPQQRNLIRKGLRIWVKVAVRSYMKRHGLAPDGTPLVPDDRERDSNAEGQLDETGIDPGGRDAI